MPQRTSQGEPHWFLTLGDAAAPGAPRGPIFSFVTFLPSSTAHALVFFITKSERHLRCWNEYKRDNGYYSKEFIDKYLEWQKQDVSNLGKQSYEFLNELLTITSYTRYSKEFTEFFTKLMGILPPKN